MRQRQHPLSQRHIGQHRVDEMCGEVGHAAGAARGAEAAALAGERDEFVRAALTAVHAAEAVREDAAAQVFARLTAGGERWLAERDFVADEHEPIRIDLWPLLTPGEHALTVELVGGGDAPLPWACDVEYRSEQPADDPACVLALHTALRTPRVAEGESVALEVKVTNRTDAGQPMAIAVVGLPAGLEVPTATLTDLQRAGAFAFWELCGRALALYRRDLAPGATHEFTIDLLARVPGRSTGPASRVNLYYTPRQTQWEAPLAVEVIVR